MHFRTRIDDGYHHQLAYSNGQMTKALFEALKDSDIVTNLELRGTLLFFTCSQPKLGHQLAKKFEASWKTGSKFELPRSSSEEPLSVEEEVQRPVRKRQTKKSSEH